MDTLDGSSSVYFEAVEHEGIKSYVNKIATEMNLTGQYAFDFVETGVEPRDVPRVPHGVKRFSRRHREPSTPERTTDADSSNEGKKGHHRLVTIECNPRATSGIHLWSRTPFLATAITDTSGRILDTRSKPGEARQVAAGMTMWDHEKASTKQFVKHFGRLVGTKDVMWSWKDIMPCVMQPFLLISYYEICREKGGMPLPEMFQSDVVWKPGMFGVSRMEGLDGSTEGDNEKNDNGGISRRGERGASRSGSS